MIIFKTKNKIKLSEKSEPRDLFSLSKSGWERAMDRDDFNPDQFVVHSKWGSYDIPGHQVKGYKKIPRKDIECYIDVGYLENKVHFDRELMQIIWDYCRCQK